MAPILVNVPPVTTLPPSIEVSAVPLAAATASMVPELVTALMMPTSVSAEPFPAANAAMVLVLMRLPPFIIAVAEPPAIADVSSKPELVTALVMPISVSAEPFAAANAAMVLANEAAAVYRRTGRAACGRRRFQRAGVRDATGDTRNNTGVGAARRRQYRDGLEAARVLDGDDGLSGEVLHQLDLLVGEGADFLAVHSEHTDQFVLLQHRDSRTVRIPPSSTAATILDSVARRRPRSAARSVT